jgi:ribosomal protein S12 methylthiotransferase
MILTRQTARIGFVSLGCAKNLVDSEIFAHELMKAGYKLAESPERSDILIINTCAFIADAKKEAIDAIFNACELKRRGKTKMVIVAGCLPQRYRASIRSLFPDVDAFIGVDGLKKIPSVVNRLLNGQIGIREISTVPRAIINPNPERIVFTSAPYAYLKIAEGCDHRCAFCAIPQIRGKYRSRPMASIVKEAEGLLSRGYHELNLIAQDVTFYGSDLGGNNNLPNLLRKIGRIGGKFWIRLLYGYPAHVGDDLLAAMAEIPQVCHYLDLPVQHCSARILQMMGRGGNENALRTLFAKIRKMLPDITLRTTCLVGFPGETENDFARLVNFIKETAFDHLGVFVFSEEEGTRAAGLPCQVSRRIALRRRGALMRAQQKNVARKLNGLLGGIDELFIEKKKAGTRNTWIARSRRQAPEIDNTVFFRDYTCKCDQGIFVKARYVRTSGYDLIAEPI